MGVTANAPALRPERPRPPVQGAGTVSEREGSQRERGARRAGRRELARVGLSEERAR